MLAEARAKEGERLFSATGFSRENISILHQQRRCLNLAWALNYAGYIQPGSVIGIVGGSFSGLMLASAIAIANDAIVYLFEKGDRLLPRFRRVSDRFISPNLNARDLGEHYDPSGSSEKASPIFRWTEDSASEVAAAWMSEFQTYVNALPIFCFLNTEITRPQLSVEKDRVSIRLSKTQPAHSADPLVVDLLIDATGFGLESNPLGLADHSYWASGHHLAYDHLAPGSRVLVSGCGDSGLVELMHYAIKDFDHRDIQYLWSRAFALGLVVDEKLRRGRLDEVTDNAEVLNHDHRLISELCWYLGTRHLRESAPAFRQTGWEAKAYAALDGHVARLLKKRFSGREPADVDHDRIERLLSSLSKSVQLRIRRDFLPVLEDLASVETGRALGELVLSKLFVLAKLHARARPGVTVVMNGTSTEPYSRQLSPFCAWAMYVMMSFPNVKYVRGRITAVKKQRNGDQEVTFADGRHASFSRVVSRYGLDSGGLLRPRSKRIHTGDWLLCDTDTRRRQRGKTGWFHVELSHVLVSDRLKVLTKRSRPAQQAVSKGMYLLRMTSPREVRHLFHNRYRDPQLWLRRQMRSGVRIAWSKTDERLK
jgi:hypothetical protein